MLGTAAEEFRSTIEREVRAVLEAAQTRAAEIERQADFNARQREQVSEHRAQQIVDSVFNRATRVLDSIDLVETALSGMLGALRAELDSLAPHGQATEVGDRSHETRDLEQSHEPESVPQPQPEALSPGPPAREEEQALRESLADLRQSIAGGEPSAPIAAQEQPAEQQPAAHEQVSEEQIPEEQIAEEQIPEEPAAQEPTAEEHPPPQEQIGGQHAATQEPTADEQPPAQEPTPEEEQPHEEHLSGPVPLNPDAQAGASQESTSQFDHMVRQQLTKMLASGKSREDAERFLERFHFGGDYLVALDEIYGETGDNHAPRRGGLFSRLRRRAR